MTYNTFLNGEFIDISQANISVLDRGFLFGDSVYEVIPVCDGIPFGMTEHLDRLEKSLDHVKMPSPMSQLQWSSIFERLLAGNELDRSIIYIQVTRGTYPTRNHQVPARYNPTVLATIMPAHHAADKTLEAMTVEDDRWHHCSIKATTLLPNVLARQSATLDGVNDAIFISNGYALEATSSNLFIAKKGRIITPPLSQNILPGITRHFLLQSLDDARIPYIERKIKLKELLSADEIWLTNSSQDLAPVIKLNGSPVGAGAAGPMWKEANDAFQAMKQNICTITENNNSELIS